MSRPRPSPDIEALLVHEPWLRGLVRTMVRDAAAADDIAQQTWLSAMRMPPADRRNLRGWLSTVARNLAARQLRREARRRRHERAAAETQTPPTQPDIERDLELRQRLLEAIGELDEPYRETIWRRYIERATTTEIATAQQVSTSTVRTRLARGIAQLRARLAPDGSSRRLTAAPLAWLFGSLPGGWLLGTTGKVTTVAVVSFLAIAGLMYADYAPETAPTGSEQDTAAVAARIDATASQQPDDGPLRTNAVLEEPPAPSTELDAVPPLAGIVLDPAGRPVASVPVGWSDDRLSPPGNVASAVDGSFSLPVANELAEDAAIEATDPRWVTLRAWPHRSGNEAATIVVAPAVPLRGRCVDDRGDGIANVELEVSAVELKQFPTSLERHRGYASQKTKTDEHGNFEFDSVPDTRDARLAAGRVGYRVHFREVPRGGSQDLVVELEAEWQDRMHGIVVDRSGNPVAGAAIDWGVATTSSDATGRFSCAWPPQRTNGMRLVAAAAGHRAFQRQYDRATWEREGRPNPVRIELGEAPLTITGTASNADGSPAHGMRVAVLDTTMLYSRKPQTTAESIAAGRPTAKPIDAGIVAEDGSFCVGGLSEGSYRLALWDPDTLLAIESEPIAAGTRGTAIVLPPDAIRKTLRGRVLSRGGRPLAGVEVAPILQLLPGIGGQARSSRKTKTDAEGRFELADVPRLGKCWIGLTGESVIGVFHPVEEFSDRDYVELRADARCQVRFLAGSPTVDASYLVFVDGDEQHVPMWSMSDNGMTPKNFVKLNGEQSAMFAITESARWLLYYHKGKEVLRRAVHLVPGELNQIAP